MVSQNDFSNVLNIVYNFAGYDKHKPISSYEIMQQTNLERKDLHDILKELAGRDLIKVASPATILTGGTAYVYITSTGLSFRENS